MQLKTAEFSYTNQNGQTVPVYLTWGGIDLQWNEGGSIIFNAYTSQADSVRKLLIGRFFLPVTAAQMIEMFSTQGYVGQVVSDRSWEMAQTKPFIPDFSAVDAATDTRTRILKSLNDLNAVITTG